ncbi:MAG: hypothetical protein J2P13_04225 [Acidobacteria bacterium]|nr:hypothetical protein [Acidobacteriota bacterium]
MNCSYCDALMPDISAFCPACGRSTYSRAPGAIDLEERLLSAAAYLGVVPGMVFVLVPALRHKSFLRFHAWQSILFAASSLVLALGLRLLFVVFSFVPIIGLLIGWLSLGIGSLGILTLWAVLLIQAARGTRFEVPLIGAVAARLAS